MEKLDDIVGLTSRLFVGLVVVGLVFVPAFNLEMQQVGGALAAVNEARRTGLRDFPVAKAEYIAIVLLLVTSLIACTFALA